jgi:hypothetical protein
MKTDDAMRQSAPPATGRALQGVRLIALYFSVVYLFPLAGNWLLGDAVISSYLLYPLGWAPVIVLAATYLLFRLLVLGFPIQPRPHLSLRTRVFSWCRRTYGRFRIYIGLISLIVAVVSLVQGLTSFRYADEAIFSRDTVLLPLLMVLYSACTADMFYFMFVRDQSRPQGRRRRVEHFLIAGALVVAASGIAMLLLSLCALTYAISPKRFMTIAFAPPGDLRIRRLLLALPLFGVIFVGAWFGGTIIKLSSGGDVDAILADPQRVANVAYTHETMALSVAHYVVERTSVFYYALVFATEVPREVLAHTEQNAIQFPLKSFAYRLNLLLGQTFQVERPSIVSMMQLNYLLLTEQPTSERAGTAPGLLASFLYVFPVPLAITACAVFLWWMAYALGDLLSQQGLRLSALGLLLALQFLIGLFSSPFDWLLVFDNDVLYAVFLYALLCVKRQDAAGLAMPQRAVRTRPLVGTQRVA